MPVPAPFAEPPRGARAASDRGPTDKHWQVLLSSVRSGDCIPFLGAGASLGFGDEAGLPTGPAVARALAEKCRYPGVDTGDLLRVAQYASIELDAHLVRRFIHKQLSRDVRPSIVHRIIASLPFHYVLTTNFDSLMERAFGEQDFAGAPAGKKAPSVAGYELRGDAQFLPKATEGAPVVYKLHGSLEKLNTMLVMEDDIVEFLSCLILGDPPFPPEIKGLFEDHSILFIGYGLKDWNVRVMLRALRGKKVARGDLTSFAVQKRPSEDSLAREWDNSVMLWERKESVQCFDVDAVAFVQELKRRYDAGEGEL
ncbi:MAG: SIR2 family protein [Gemmatimonadaceae bacterium]